MASPLRLTACWGETGQGRSARWVEDAWTAVRAEFEAAEAAMSRFRETSDVTRLNRAAGSGQGVRVPRRLERALVAADRAHRITDGRFDPRVLRDLDRLGYAGVPVAEARPDGRTRRHGSSSAPVTARSPSASRSTSAGSARASRSAGPRRRSSVTASSATSSRRAAISSRTASGPRTMPGSWGSRTRPAGRSPSRPSRCRTLPPRPRRSGGCRGSTTADPSTTCSIRGPANRPRPGCVP